MECRITGIYFIMSMKLWTILMINCPPSCNPINLSYRVYSRLDCLLRCTESSFQWWYVYSVHLCLAQSTHSCLVVLLQYTEPTLNSWYYYSLYIDQVFFWQGYSVYIYCWYCYSVLRVQLFLVLLQCTEYTYLQHYSFRIITVYYFLCLEYTVSSGIIIIIEFIDCIFIWDISTRYIVYLYFEYYLSVQLAVRP